MSMTKEYYEKKKINGGCGGLHCSCCNPLFGEKAIARRLNRRINKQNLRKEIEKETA